MVLKRNISLRKKLEKLNIQQRGVNHKNQNSISHKQKDKIKIAWK